MANIISNYKKQHPEYANIPDLELADVLYNQVYKNKLGQEEFYKLAFPDIAEARPKEDFVEPIPEEGLSYLEGKGINFSVTENESFKPTIAEIAERSNVSTQDPASYESRKIASYGFNQEQKELGVKKSLSKLYNQDIDVRIGPNTGQLEYFNPNTQQYALVDKPGFDKGDLADLYGDGLVLGADLITTIVASAVTGPIGGISAGAVAAGAAEFYRLKLGQKYGINQDLDDYALFKEGIKTGVISGIAGTAGLGVGYIIKGVNNVFAGRSFHFKNADILQEEKVLKADEIQNNINKVLEDGASKARLKFSLAKATDDTDLLSVQSAFENTKRLGKVDNFRKFNIEEATALNEYFGILKKGFGTSSDTTFNNGTLIKEVIENRQKPIIKEAITKKEQAEDLLTKTLFKLPDGSEKITGAEVRSILSDIGQNYKDLASKASTALDNAAGVNLINTDKVAAALKLLSEKEQRSLVEVSKLEGVFKPEVYNQLLSKDGTMLLKDARETISVLGKLIRDKFQGKTTGESVDTGKLLKLQSSFLEQLNKDAGSGYMDQLQNFNNLVRQNKELLDNDLMSKLTKIEVGNKLKIAEEDIFLTTFLSGKGSGKAAQEVYDVIHRSSDAMIAYKNSIFELYKSKVLTDGVPNLTKHNAFIKDYDKPLRKFFNESEYKKISKIGGLKKYIDTQNKTIDLMQKNLNRSFEGKLLNSTPQEIFNKIYKPNNIGEIDKLKNILIKDPNVYKAFQRDVLTDLNERVMVKNDKLGMKVLDAKAFNNFLNGAGGERGYRAALEKVFDKEYVKNLDILNDALQIASRKPTATGVEGMLGSAFSDIIRAQVGQFSRTGRIFTASRRLFRTAANRMIANAILDPKSLKLLVELRKYKSTNKIINGILGKLGGSIFILPDEGEIELPGESDQTSSLLNNKTNITQMASLPEIQTPPLETVGVNPASFDNTLLAQGTVGQTGLTQSEQAFLDDEEKAMTLRNRGMA